MGSVGQEASRVPSARLSLRSGCGMRAFFWVLVKKPHWSVMESECEG